MYYYIPNISIESMDIYLYILLNLPDVTVKHCEKINQGVCLHVELLNSGASCRVKIIQKTLIKFVIWHFSDL